MKTTEVIEKLKIFLGEQIDTLAITYPLISFGKPIITRIINSKLHDNMGLFSMVADENGNIDVQSLIPEMIESVMTTDPFIVHTGILGDLEIGGGKIKINIPTTNNQIVLGKDDLDSLKKLFLEN